MKQQQVGVVRNDYVTFSPTEFERRHATLHDLMTEKQLDGTIVYGGYKVMYQANARWLTNMAEGMQYYAFFPRNGEPRAWNSLYPHLIAAQRMSVIPRTEWGGQSIAEAVAAYIAELGLQGARIGLVGIHAARGITLPMDHYLIWKAMFPDLELVNITRELEDARMVKSEEELDFYRKGASLTDHAMAELIKAVAPGVNEQALYGRIMTSSYEVGGELDFALLGSTPMSDPDMPYPWHVPTERRIAEGDVVLNEISVSYGGCSGQLIVPIFVGQPTAEYLELYEIARQALENARRVLRPGATRDDILEAARPITDNGLTSQASFIHGWPNPPMRPTVRLGDRGQREQEEPFTLQENMLIMIEPNPVSQDRKRGIFLGALHVVRPEGGLNLHDHSLDYVVV